MRFAQAIEVARPLEEAFAYVADLANAAEWDPGIVESHRTGEGPVGPGAEFDVVALFRSRPVPFRYRLVGYEQGRRVLFEGEGEKARSVDEILFEPAGSGTRIAYAADLTLKGPLRLFEPFLGGTFRVMGEKALAGLKATLDRA